LFTVHLPDVEEFLAAARPSKEEATRIKRKALRQMHGKVMRQTTKPDRTSDKFVDWRFKQDWERKDLPLGMIAGTDYDYFDAAIADCIQLFEQWGFPGKFDPDAPGRIVYGEISKKYNKAYAVWQNGALVQSYTGLSGPWVDFGPTVDYAIFLEKSITKTTNNLGAPYFRAVGVLHAIADRVQRKYGYVHRVFAHTQRPEGGSTIATQRGRREQGVEPSIETFPVIRIMHRHWKG
jgi:hypothetical protein